MKKLKWLLSLLTVSFLMLGLFSSALAEGAIEKEIDYTDSYGDTTIEEEIIEDEDAIKEDGNTELKNDEESEESQEEEVEDDLKADESEELDTSEFFLAADVANPHIWYEAPDHVIELSPIPTTTAFTRLREAVNNAEPNAITHIVISFHINTGTIGVDGSTFNIPAGATVVLIGHHANENTSIIESNDRRIVIADTHNGISRTFRVRGNGNERTALVFRNIVVQNSAASASQSTPATPPAPLALGSQTALVRGSGMTSEGLGGGGHLILCRDSMIRNATTNNNGTVDVQTNSLFTMQEGSQIINSAAENNGGAVWVGNNARFNMYGGVIAGNFARTQAGGGVAISGGTFNMHGGEIRNNRAGATAAGAFTAAAQNTANNIGGAVHSMHAEANFNWYGGEIHSNSAANGGGISIANGTIHMAEGCVLRNNTATGTSANGIGGGVHVTGGHFHLNGGEISILSGEVTIHNGEIHNNQFVNTVGGTGGGVFLSGGTLNLNNGSIHSHGGAGNRQVINGGGVFLSGGTFVMTGGNIRNNITTGAGGGVGAAGTGTAAIQLDIQNGTIHHNTAAIGGGVGITRTATLSAAATAAAVPVLTMSGGAIENNNAANFPGIHFAPVVNNIIATTVSSILPNNTFTITGEAIVDQINYVPNVTQTKNGTSGNTHNTLSFNLSGQTRIGSLTIAPSLSIPGTATTAGRTNTFSFNLSNQAIVEAGIIFRPTLTTSAGTTGASTRNNILNLTINGGTIHHGLEFAPIISHAGGTTGNITRVNTLNFMLNDGIIHAGINFIPAVTSAGGTAGNHTNHITFVQNGGTITGGTRLNGGGVCFEPTINSSGGATAAANRANNSTFRINGGTIRDGIAQLNGGGVYHRPNSTITGAGAHNIIMEINGGHIDHNRALANGGGLYMTFATTGGTVPSPIFNMNLNPDNTKAITNNTAGQNGGGIFIPSILTFTGMTNANISNNEAKTGLGGAVFVETPINMTAATGTFTMINSQVNNNISYGNGASIWVNRMANFIMTDSSMNGNKTIIGHGGGMHFAPLGTDSYQFTMNGSSTINQNTAGQNGGGIWLDNVNLTLQGSSSISGNIAGQNGGGVTLTNGATFDLINGTIQGNRANNGGGIYVDELSFFTGNRGFIVDNAADSGGAIFTERYAEEILINAEAYNNLRLTTEVIFSGNIASFATFGPVNPEVINDHIPMTLVGSIPNTHILNHYDINYPTGPIGTFTFFKVDELMYLDFDQASFLEGAVFELYDYQNGEWILNDRQESDSVGRVHFAPLRLNTTYRLIEVQPPVGFQIPRGHWLIEIDMEGNKTITAEGDFLPAFLIHEDEFYLGNIGELEIPVLGGLGRNELLIFTGLTMIIVASGLTLLVKRRRKNRIS